ncbi:MAG: ATP-binding protein [Deltaproteobacteria bacterium]|nr:ATP-binding protein [Deltaproteobacteria bacterium]
MLSRIVNVLNHSFFLFGPRGTGKTFFLQQKFASQKTFWLDLLDPLTEERYALRPGALRDEILKQHKGLDWVVIDEVQKLPRLLDIVHQLIESHRIRFALTGSSARKLKRGAANLLAGRAFVYHLHPMTHRELGATLDLDRAIVRKLDPFRRFLEIAAQTNGEIINYTNIARDVGADTKTVQSYFQILEDTLVGFFLEPYHRSIRKQQRKAPKFYLFDTGIKRALEGTLTQSLVPNTYGYGKAFEHFVILELLRLNDYGKKDYRFAYLLTKDHAEIDLIIERPGLPPALVEIKSTERVDDRDTAAIEHFLPDFRKAEGFCLSRDPAPKKIGHVTALPWDQGIRELGLIPP